MARDKDKKLIPPFINRWKKEVPEYNSGEIIVQENLTIKIRQLMEDWTVPSQLPKIKQK